MKVMLALLAAFLFVGVANATEIQIPLLPEKNVVETKIPVTAYRATVTQRVTVQRVARKDGLRSGDQAVIDQYLSRYRGKLDATNYMCLVEALPVLVGNGDIDARDCNGRLVLNQSPKHYLTMRQNYGAVVSGTDWYANIPMLPAFNPPASQGKLAFMPATLGEAEPQEPCKPRAEGFPAQSWNQGHAGSSQLNTTNWAVGWTKEQRAAPKPQVCKPKPPPPPPASTPCPPGGPPPEQSPIGCNVLPTDGGSNIHVPLLPPPPSSR